MNSFRKYQLCLLKITFHDFEWVRDFIISTVIAAVTTAIQIHWQIISSDQRRVYWISVVGPYILVLGAHLAWKRFTASWKLYTKQEDLIADKDSEIVTFKEKQLPDLRSLK